MPMSQMLYLETGEYELTLGFEKLIRYEAMVGFPFMRLSNKATPGVGLTVDETLRLLYVAADVDPGIPFVAFSKLVEENYTIAEAGALALLLIQTAFNVGDLKKKRPKAQPKETEKTTPKDVKK